MLTVPLKRLVYTLTVCHCLMWIADNEVTADNWVYGKHWCRCVSPWPWCCIPRRHTDTITVCCSTVTQLIYPSGLCRWILSAGIFYSLLLHICAAWHDLGQNIQWRTVTVTQYWQDILVVPTDPGSSWTLMEFKVHIFQAWNILESGLGHGKSWKMNCCIEQFWHVPYVT